MYEAAVRKYEATVRENNLKQAFNDKDYAKTFELGREILKLEPEDFSTLVLLVQAGYLHQQAGNKSLNEDSVVFAKQAIQLVESGKVTSPAPLLSMEFARALLNFNLGFFLLEKSPTEAAAAFLKALRSESTYKNEPSTYYFLGTAILKGEYRQLSTEYEAKYANKPETPEGRALLERINRVVDRVIDAYARAVALSTKPEQQDFRNKLLEQLTSIYKSLHNNSDAGLNELIANVLSKPLP